MVVAEEMKISVCIDTREGVSKVPPLRLNETSFLCTFLSVATRTIPC